MRLLVAVLVVQVVLGGALIALVATDNVPLVRRWTPTRAPPRPGTCLVRLSTASTRRPPLGSVKRQVAIGPRPAGSGPVPGRWPSAFAAASRSGRFVAVPGGLRNVVGTIPGRARARPIVIGAHYDTKDLPGFVGANDGASGVAVLTQLARTIKPGRLRRPVVLVAFDGEESPRGTASEDFEARGLRGSKSLAPPTGTRAR